MSRFFPSDPLEGKGALLARLNPNKFYVENVRQLLKVSHGRAVVLCDAGVQQGYFRAGIDLLTPDSTVAYSTETPADIPATIRYWREEEGHLEEVEISTKSLERLKFYRLNEHATASI